MNNTTKYPEYPITNREFKSTLFVMSFKRKNDLLDLYNALNDSNHQNLDDLEITTLDNAIYMTYKNDVSFLLGGMLNLYEHQSTPNPNMPIRGLLYFARMYEKFISSQNINIYSEILQKLPTPHYIVFYNGAKDQPDKSISNLSDAFIHDGGCLECEVTMLNINYGRNKELMEKCKRLNDYSHFIARVREFLSKGHPRETAINQAIDECIEKNILKDILIDQRNEVLGVLLSTFNKELYEQDLKDNAYNAGHADGFTDGLANGRSEGEILKLKNQIQKKLAKGKSSDMIADELEESIETITELISQVTSE